MFWLVVLFSALLPVCILALQVEPGAAGGGGAFVQLYIKVSGQGGPFFDNLVCVQSESQQSVLSKMPEVPHSERNTSLFDVIDGLFTSQRWVQRLEGDPSPPTAKL